MTVQQLIIQLQGYANDVRVGPNASIMIQDGSGIMPVFTVTAQRDEVRIIV